MVDDGKIFDVVKHAIDGKVATKSIFSRRTKDVFGKEKVLVRVVRQLLWAGLTAKGGDLNQIVTGESDMGQTKPPTDQKAVAKQFFDLFWGGIGGDVEILRLTLKEQVTHSAADQIGLIAVPAQPVEDLKGIFVDLLARDAVLGARYDEGLIVNGVGIAGC